MSSSISWRKGEQFDQLGNRTSNAMSEDKDKQYEEKRKRASSLISWEKAEQFDQLGKSRAV